MKLVFNEITTPGTSIDVSFDGGKTWLNYDVEQLRQNNNEIHFTEEQCPDLTQIKIKGRFKTYSDVDVLYNPSTIVSVAKPEGGAAYTSDAIINYVGDQIGNLTTDKIGAVGSYIDSIQENKGIISASHKAFDTIINKDSTNTSVPSSKAVYDALQSLGNLYTIKESVASKDNLPKTNNNDGDVRNCKDTGTNYVWINNSWSPLGGTNAISALDFAGAVADGVSREFITQVTQDDGLVHATKAFLPTASEEYLGIVKLNDSVASSSKTTAATANAVKTVNDSLITEIANRKSAEAVIKVDLKNEVADRKNAISSISSVNNTAIKQALANISGYTNNTRPDVNRTVYAFTQENGKVTMIFKDIEISQDQVTGLKDALAKEIYDRDVAITTAIDSLDSKKVGKDGSYIKYVEQENGIVKAEIKSFDGQLNALSDTTNAPNSKVVYTAIMDESNARDAADKAEVTARNKAINDAIELLDVESVGSDGSYINTIKETNGKISATKKAFDKSITSTATDNNVPTTKAVYNAIQALGNVYNIKSPVDSFDALPVKGNIPGDVRDVRDTGDNYVWTGDAWDRLGGTNAINSLNYGGAGASGTSTAFITQLTQTNGKVSATKANLPISSTVVAGIVKLNDTLDSESDTEAATANVARLIQKNLNSEIDDRKKSISALDHQLENTKKTMLPITGGTMEGDIIFSATQEFPISEVKYAKNLLPSGTAGYVLVSNGTESYPTWRSITSLMSTGSEILASKYSVRVGKLYSIPFSEGLYILCLDVYDWVSETTTAYNLKFNSRLAERREKGIYNLHSFEISFKNDKGSIIIRNLSNDIYQEQIDLADSDKGYDSTLTGTTVIRHKYLCFDHISSDPYLGDNYVSRIVVR